MNPQSVGLAPGETKMIETVQNWSNPHLWDINDPYLYYLSSELIASGQTVDRNYTQFGFRELWINGTDFILNGRKIILQGDSVVWATTEGTRTTSDGPCLIDGFSMNTPAIAA